MQNHEIEATVIGVLVRDLGIARDEIRLGARLEEDLGLDSLGMVELLLALEEACRLSIPDERVGELTTVAAVIDLVAAIGGYGVQE